MTTAHNIDLSAVLAERLTTAHLDVLGELLATYIHTLMGAEVDALCGAGYAQRSSGQTNSFNGYSHREFGARAGTLDLAILNVHALIVTGVHGEGYREILGIDVTTAKDGAGWLMFWRSLTPAFYSGGANWSPATPTPGSAAATTTRRT